MTETVGNRRRKLTVVVSSELTIKAFLRQHLRRLSEVCELVVIANTQDTGILQREGIRVPIDSVGIVRPVRPWADVRALIVLACRFARRRDDAVLSITPKAGLLAMLAAFVARVPIRMHIFTGQVWATRSGLSRTLLKSLDRVMARLATHVMVDGEPQRQFLIAEGVLRADTSVVLGHGSLGGVDGQRFMPNDDARVVVRSELGLSSDAVVFLYVGRFNRDKGVLDLAQAFSALAQSFPHAHLLMVGPDEAGMISEVRVLCSGHQERLHFVGYTDKPERYMAAADVFCLPSYREGFPTSVLEAGASGLPTVASRIYGIEGAVVDGITGLLHAPGKADDIQSCLLAMLESPSRRTELGRTARERTLALFSAGQVTGRLVDYILARMDEVR